MSPRADEKPQITVRRAAMNLLARREQSFHELITKLEQKYPEFDRKELILPALEKLRDENLQSDERFVEAYIRYRRTRGHGPKKVGMELRQKGVSDSLIQLELYDEANDWIVHCQEAMEKKFSTAELKKQAVREKCYRFLTQRGFDSGHIQAVMKQIKY